MNNERFDQKTFDEKSNIADEQFLRRIFHDGDFDSNDNFPMADLPIGLSDKLYAIPKRSLKPIRQVNSWKKIASVAVAACIALILVGQGVEYRQMRLDTLQAKKELEVVFYYLNQTNQKVSNDINKTLKESLQKSTVIPVIESVYEISSS